MKCLSCEKEIMDGSNYCSFCGKPTSIVPEYNIFEDEDINIILQTVEEEKRQKDNDEAKKKAEILKKKEELKLAVEQELKKRRGARVTVSIIIIVCVLLVAAGIFTKITIDNKNANSYSYHMNQAEKFEDLVDYDQAIIHYKKAMELEPKDLTVRLKLVDVYFEIEKDEKAVALLHETVKADPSAYDAYKKLLSYYEMNKDLNSILSLRETVTDSRVKNLFEDYIVESPKINIESGTYNNLVKITISSNMKDSIYYTLDGSDPTIAGMKYTSYIQLDKKGTYNLKAVCMNKKGVYSDVITEKYTITIDAPDEPVVSITKTGEIIDGTAKFTEETYITIHVSDKCVAYYTWDNTTPDKENGTLYRSPIPVPEGDHILSIIIFDEVNDLQSIIYRNRFEYTPGEASEIEEVEISTEDLNQKDTYENYYFMCW